MNALIRKYTGDYKLVFTITSIIIILFFSFNTVKCDLIGADPFLDFGKNSTEGNGTFEIAFSSGRLLFVTVRTDAPEGTPFRIELEAKDDNIAMLEGKADENGYVLFCSDSIIDLSGNDSCEVRLTSEIDFRLFTGETGNVWYRNGYLWITKGVLRICGMIAGSLFMAFVYYLCFVKQLACERIFLWISLPLCVLFAIIIPVYRVADEYMHFMRGMALARGYLILPSDALVMLPENIVPFYVGGPFDKYFSLYGLFHGGDIILSSVDKAWNLETVALYNPLVYSFSTIGQALADVFTDSLNTIVISGRLGNIIGCTYLLYLAIKYIPKGKELLMIMSIFPINLQMRASTSADALTYAAGVVLTAFVVYMRYSDRKMDLKHLLYMYAALILIGSCKVVYFVMAFMIILIPDDKFSSHRSARLHKVFGILITFVLAIVWLRIASNYLAINPGGGNASEKIIYAITHPFWYVKIMAMTTLYRLPGWGYQAIAPYLGYYDIKISILFWGLMAAGFVSACFYYVKQLHKADYKRDNTVSIVMLLSSFVVLMLFFASLYVQWNVGSPADIHLIEGIQGRYFAPLLPAIFIGILGMPVRINPADEREHSSLVFGILSVSNIMVLLNVMISCTYVL